MKGYVYLEDGTVFEGKLLGSEKDALGEIVFNTSMTGYQEVLTDPSYASQIIVMTYPLIGNYGMGDKFSESEKIYAKGFVTREKSSFYSHVDSQENMEDFLKKNNITGIYEVDTRALTKRIRNKGTMKSLISKNKYAPEEAMDIIASWDFPKDIVKEVSTKNAYEIVGNKAKVAVIDFGIKRNILESIKKFDFHIKVFPCTVEMKEIDAFAPSGILLSNGPGDPKDVDYVIPVIQECMEKYPIFGICLGHQLLSLSLGADTYKLPFGHRGGNHPVKDIRTNKIYMTSQNHGYAVRNIKDLNVDITHFHVNDQTIEGIKHKDLSLFSVQFHPEAAPGPLESAEIFQEFYNMCTK